MTIIGLDPRPDEALHSALGRYSDKMGFPNRRSILVEAFGSPSAVSGIDFAGRLSALARSSSAGIGTRDPDAEAERLAWEHTALPYFARVMPPARISAALGAMLGGGGKVLHNLLGVRASVVPLPPALRHCPECVEADRAEFGDAHWHRSHQVAGVLACAEHGVLLRRNAASRTVQRDRLGFLSAERCLLTGPASDERTLETCPKLLDAISKDSAWLMTGARSQGEAPSVLWSRRFGHLHAAGFGRGECSIAINRLRTELGGFFGDAFLESVGCRLGSDGADDWLARFVRKPKGAQHPLQHILLARFLDMPVAVLPGSGGVVPALPGPAPTPPVIAAPIPSSMEVRTRRRGERPPHGDTAWDDRLRRLVEDGEASLREIARELAVATRTVQRRAHLLGVWRPSWTKRAASAPATRRSRSARRTLRRHRGSWRRLIERNPSISVTELRRLKPGTYSHLYRYDRAWLDAASPPAPRAMVARTPARDGRVDWARRDDVLLAEARSAVSALRAATDRPRRIRVATVTDAMGRSPVLQQHGNKLPLTVAFIDGQVEDRTAHARRKLAWYVGRCRMAGMVPMEAECVRAAGLRPDLAATLEHEIAAMIAGLTGAASEAVRS